MAAHLAVCLYLRPSALEMIELGQAFRDALKAPDRSRQAYFGLFPFRWKDNWKQSFDAYEGWTFVWHQFCRRSFLTRHRGKPLIGRTRWRTGISSCYLTRPSRQVRVSFGRRSSWKQPSIAVSSFASGCAPTQEDFKFLRELEESLTKGVSRHRGKAELTQA